MGPTCSHGNVIGRKKSTLKRFLITLLLIHRVQPSSTRSLNISYTNWISPSAPTIPIRSPPATIGGAAIGYSSANNVVWFIGGQVHHGLLSYNANIHTFINHGDSWLSTWINGKGQYYTQINDYLFIIDGFSHDSLIRFNVNTNDILYNYHSIPYTVSSGACLASITIHNHLYLFLLGRGYTTGASIPISNTLQILNLTDNSWYTDVPHMQLNRSTFACIVNGGTLYAIGGHGGGGYHEDALYHDTVETLDVSDIYTLSFTSWILLTDRLSHPISAHIAVNYLTDVLVIGGIKPPDDSYIHDINVIDTVTNTIMIKGSAGVDQYFGYNVPTVIVDDIVYVFSPIDYKIWYMILTNPTSTPIHTLRTTTLRPVSTDQTHDATVNNDVTVNDVTVNDITDNNNVGPFIVTVNNDAAVNDVTVNKDAPVIKKTKAAVIVAVILIAICIVIVVIIGVYKCFKKMKRKQKDKAKHHQLKQMYQVHDHMAPTAWTAPSKSQQSVSKATNMPKTGPILPTPTTSMYSTPTPNTGPIHTTPNTGPIYTTPKTSPLYGYQTSHTNKSTPKTSPLYGYQTSNTKSTPKTSPLYGYQLSNKSVDVNHVRIPMNTSNEKQCIIPSTKGNNVWDSDSDSSEPPPPPPDDDEIPQPPPPPEPEDDSSSDASIYRRQREFLQEELKERGAMMDMSQWEITNE